MGSVPHAIRICRPMHVSIPYIHSALCRQCSLPICQQHFRPAAAVIYVASHPSWVQVRLLPERISDCIGGTSQPLCPPPHQTCIRPDHVPTARHIACRWGCMCVPEPSIRAARTPSALACVLRPQKLHPLAAARPCHTLQESDNDVPQHRGWCEAVTSIEEVNLHKAFSF